MNNEKPWLSNGFVFLLLAFSVFLIYSGNIDGPFIFDDSRLQNNPQILITSLSFKNLLKAGLASSPQTRPVAYISFALNFLVHGFATRGYHLVNMAIHALAAFFLYLFIQKTLDLPSLERRYRDYSFLPLAAALVWALHPLQTQSVTYIIQRMNAMAAMFYMLSLYLYIKGRLAHKAAKKWPLFLSAGFAGLLALGSKETAATLPFFIFLYEWYFLQDLDLKWFRKQLFPVALVLASITILVLLYLDFNPAESILATYAGRDFTPYQRLLTEFRVVIFYISLLLFPHPSRLNLDHHFILSTGLFSPVTTVISAIILLLLLLTALTSAKKNRLLSFCLLWFLGNMVIESSVIGLEVIFEHRNYLPSMMFILLVVFLLFPLFSKTWTKFAFFGFMVIFLSFLTFERNKVWSDKISLWGDSVAKSPQKARPHNNFGVALKDKGRLAAAAVQFEETIRLDPKFSEAYNNLASTYMLLGKYEEGLNNFKMALKTSPDNPTVHVNLGNALLKRWKLEEALLHYGEALRLKPDYEEARLNFLSTRRLIDARKSRNRTIEN